MSAVVAPNPSLGGAAVLIVSLPHSAEVRVSVYDVTGRLVGSVSEHALAQGLNEVNLETSTLAPGVYVAVVQTAGGTGARTRFTVVR